MQNMNVCLVLKYEVASKHKLVLGYSEMTTTKGITGQGKMLQKDNVKIRPGNQLYR